MKCGALESSSVAAAPVWVVAAGCIWAGGVPLAGSALSALFLFTNGVLPHSHCVPDCCLEYLTGAWQADLAEAGLLNGFDAGMTTVRRGGGRT